MNAAGIRSDTLVTSGSQILASHLADAAQRYRVPPALTPLYPEPAASTCSFGRFATGAELDGRVPGVVEIEMEVDRAVLIRLGRRLDDDRRLVDASVDRLRETHHRLAEQLACARVDDSSGDRCRRAVPIRDRVSVGLVQPGDPLLARPLVRILGWHTAGSRVSIVHEFQRTD
jgi:hypothetical protein